MVKNRLAQSVILRYAVAVGGVALTTLLLQAVKATVGLEGANISLGYIVAVLVVAITYGLGPGVVASVLAFLAFNFFFVPPILTFTVANRQDLIRLIFFLGVAVITSSIGARSRARAEEARRRARIQQALYDLSQAISAEVKSETILPIIAQQIVRLLHVAGCVILIYDGDALRAAIASGVVGSDGHAIAMPLRAGERPLGLLRVWERPGGALTSEELQLLETLARQAALAVERTQLVEETTRLQLVDESDRLKSALLHSISHDLRTPLAAIKGASSNLMDESVTWTTADRRSFLGTIDVETDRLNRLVRNLLDMSRLEAGAYPLTKEPALFDEVLEPVLRRLQRTLESHIIAVDMPDDLPFVPMAVLQVDQVLTNLLENAARYAPPTTTITIGAHTAPDALQIDIADEGPGIPATEREHIFERFYRLSGPESASGGTGLGLAIAKGLVEAQGGRIWVHPREGGGAIFSFTLPISNTAAMREAYRLQDSGR